MSSLRSKSLKEQLAVLAENYGVVNNQYTNTKGKSYTLSVISKAL